MRAPRARRRSRYQRALASMLSTRSTLSSRGASRYSRAVAAGALQPAQVTRCQATTEDDAITQAVPDD